MIRHNSRTAVRAVLLSALVVVSLSAATVPLADNVTGAVTDGSLTVTNQTVAPDGTVEVEGETGNSEVTFLVQDPETGGASTHTVTGLSTSGTFTTTLNLSTDFDIEYNDGEATLMADEGATFDTAEDTTTFEIDEQSPTVDITAPTDGENISSADSDTYLIEGSATDDHSLDRVEIALQNETTGDHYDATSDSWQSSRAWIEISSVQGSASATWEYDTSGVVADGNYEVIVRVFDSAGNKRSYLLGPQTYSDDDTLQVAYTLDTTAPTVTNVNVTELNSDDTVEKGDKVNVSATVTDPTAGVDTVTVDASPLNASGTIDLVQDSGDTYAGSFVVDSPSVGDGTVTLDVTANDEFGQSNTGSDSLTLETKIDSVGTLTVHQQFLGVVDDANTSVAVTATGVEDARGNPIADGPGSGTEQATLDIGGTSFTVDVDGGEIDDTIDPTEIANSTATGDTTVEIAEAGDNSATDTVELVHEANALQEGYQIEATPMDATTVEYQYVDSALTYDPESGSWVAPETTRAGSAYYLNGVNDSARVGYTFAKSGQLNSRYLHEGYNLVGATPDLNDEDEVGVGADVGGAMSVSSSNVDVYERDETEPLSDPSGSTDASAFVKNNNAKVGPYEGYYVYVEDGEEVRVVEAADYEPAQGS